MGGQLGVVGWSRPGLLAACQHAGWSMPSECTLAAVMPNSLGSQQAQCYT